MQRKELEAELELAALHLAETEILLGKHEARTPGIVRIGYCGSPTNP